MAESLEFEFTVFGDVEKSKENFITKSSFVPEKSSTKEVVELPEILGEATPLQYTLDQYYKNDPLGRDVLVNKYLSPWEKSPYDMWKRVAGAIASIEESTVDHWYMKFFHILEDFRFVPGGRIMHGAGRDDITTTLNNCYVMAIRDDSVKSIYKTLVEEALTYKYGGGCGHDLSILRPSGTPIEGTGGVSCGPTGFMNLFSENTNTIAQHGRRGANMQTLRVDHPDIENFIDIKRGNTAMVRYSNISVLITHEFMTAVEKDLDFPLRWNGKVFKTVKATELWKKIIRSAQESAEPGIIFWDTMKEYHNAEYCSPIISTNPCGEQPLPDGGCCNLGSINLERYVGNDGNFLLDEFKEGVSTAIRFMDNVVTYNLNRHALQSQKENALKDRRVGLGLLGLGDMFVKMGISYDSEKALEIAEFVTRTMRDISYNTSIEISKEKGAFENFQFKGFSKSKFFQSLPDDIKKNIEKYGIRNATILTVPPTGSGAIVARVTSGIEPIFQTSYFRRVKENEGYGTSFREYKVYHPVVQRLFGTDENLPNYVVTAHDINPYFRVKMQGVIQKYIDSSISSTVNLASDTSPETVADIYMAAYKAGLKGITVYREGSREGILITEEQKAKEAKSSPRVQKTDVVIPEEKANKNVVSGHSLKPRLRPMVTDGITKRIRTGEGSLYITINHDEHGLCEVFTTIGKAGGYAAAQSEAISRLISLALRSGINPTDIIKQLKGISGPNPTWENGHLVLSTPDAIGKALEDYLKEITVAEPKIEASESNRGSAKFSLAENDLEKPATDFSARTMTICPDCGSTIKHENGCVVCVSCGFSKCD